MPLPVDLTRLTPSNELRGEDGEDHELVQEMLQRAYAYLSAFSWCRAIRECYAGDVAIGKVVLVLLFRIDPAHEGVDDWLWVVVGDLPPAYLVTDEAPTASEALRGYVHEMRRWIEAVKHGEPVDQLIPVETFGGDALEPTPEIVDLLERRLDYFENELLN
ncbi:MAG: hypothetical protein ACXWYS_07320 [Gaiellaceae bacterium]